VVDDLPGWAEAHDLAVVELAPESTRPRTPATALGTPLPIFTENARAHSPRRTLVGIPDGRLRGRYGLVVLPDGAFAAEAVYGRSHLEAQPDFVRPVPREAQRIRGDVCTLVGEFSGRGNWFHWVHDGLLRLDGLAQHLPRGTRFAVHDGSDGFEAETLRMVGIPEDRILPFHHDDTWVCDRLWFASHPAWTSTDPEAGRRLRERLLAAAGVTRTNPARRLYVSRSDCLHGRVIDEVALGAVLERHGFEVVLPGTSTVAEQIRLFAGAAAVVGPTGAGFTGLLFADPSTRVLEILEPTWARRSGHILWSCLEFLGQPYAYVVGRTVANPDRPERANLSIDPEALDGALTDWLGRP